MCEKLKTTRRAKCSVKQFAPTASPASLLGKQTQRPWKTVKDPERARSCLAFQMYLNEVVKTSLPPMHLWFRFMHAIAPWLNNWRGRPVLFQEELRQQSLPTKGMRNIAGQQYLKTARPSCRLKSVSLERIQGNDRKRLRILRKSERKHSKSSSTMGDSNHCWVWIYTLDNAMFERGRLRMCVCVCVCVV